MGTHVSLAPDLPKLQHLQLIHSESHGTFVRTQASVCSTKLCSGVMIVQLACAAGEVTHMLSAACSSNIKLIAAEQMDFDACGLVTS